MRLVSANEAGIGYFTLVASGGKYRPRGLHLAKASVSLWLDPRKENTKHEAMVSKIMRRVESRGSKVCSHHRSGIIRVQRNGFPQFP